MKRVLVVEDSGTVRKIVNGTLRKAGFEVIEAADGADGLSIATTDESIAMILCDIHMPRLSGLEMVEQLDAGRKARIPIVMLTTEADGELIERAKKAGAKGWIVKPFTPEVLLNAVNRLTT